MATPRKLPVALSIDHLRHAGFLAERVDRWIPITRPRKGAPPGTGPFDADRVPARGGFARDLFRFADIAAFRPDKECWLIQATSKPNMSARCKKILANIDALTLSSWGFPIEVWGWRSSPRTPGRHLLYRVRLHGACNAPAFHVVSTHLVPGSGEEP